MFRVVEVDGSLDKAESQVEGPPTGDFSNFECDKCGACCKFLAVQVEYPDIVREPRIKEFLEGELSQDAFVTQTNKKYWVNDFSVDSCQCAFLSSDNSCSIYSTRPNLYVGFHAGSPLCQFSRGLADLPMLLDRDGSKPDEDLSRAFAVRVEGVGRLAYVDEGAIEDVSRIANDWRSFQRKKYLSKADGYKDSYESERKESDGNAT